MREEFILHISKCNSEHILGAFLCLLCLSCWGSDQREASISMISEWNCPSWERENFPGKGLGLIKSKLMKPPKQLADGMRILLCSL